MRNTSVSGTGITSLGDTQPALRYLTGVDWGLLVSALLLAAVGLATVHSASSELAIDYLPRQAIWLGLGVISLLVASSVDYHTLLDHSSLIYLCGLAGLVLVFFLGHEAGGAQSRLGFAGFSVQPSEFAKLATAIALSRYLGELKQPYLELRNIAVALAIVSLPVAAVAAEPDLGSAAMFLPMAAGMLLVGGIRWRTLVGAGVVALLLAAGVWSFGMQTYQRQRVITFLAPDSDPLGAGYQVRQSKIAVGSGGLVGQGYMQGTQSQLRFLPARHTDFVFAVLAEEWGFLGVMTVIALYALFLYCAARVALRARNRTGILLVSGLVSLMAFHIVYNTAMVVGLVPITGIPLPFLSYGGSFTLMCFLATGMILGVDLRRYVNR